ncbi:MAG: uroporphyrinogen decarboxylase [Kosmotoga sp.]|nr:MAG: uroporphyrinogen decarboxylase [Kosmotoga sp.]
MEFVTGRKNGKSILLDVFEKKETKRVPWVPFAGVHAGKLLNHDANEILNDSRKLYESLLEVKKIYEPDGMPVVFDLQLEAEVLGCELQWDKKSPPTVRTPPLLEKKIPSKIPEPTEGRYPIVLETMEKLKSSIGDEVALFGLICGPFTLASHLRGTQFFMDLIEDRSYSEQLLKYTSDVVKRIIEFYVDADMDVIAVVDPLVSQISPRHFRQHLKSPFKEIFDYIRDKNTFSAFFVCGDASKNIEPMCETLPDAVFVDENVDIVEAKKITSSKKIIIGGNIPLTTTMLYGTQMDNMKYVVDLIDSVGKMDFILAPGCDMPYDTPPENVVAAGQAAKQIGDARDILKNYKSEATLIDIKLPDYEKLEKPLIEVFTIDSSTCAACTYMYNTAMLAKEKFGDSVDVVEYKSTTPEGIARVRKLNIEKLPSILINGQLAFSSIIPDQKKLFKRIEDVLR